MKLSVFKGIAHDLADSLHSDVFSGYWKDIVYPVDTDALEEKDTFDKSCVAFVKERVKASFDFSRVKKILIKMKRSAMFISCKVTIVVDDKEFSHSFGSV